MSHAPAAKLEVIVAACLLKSLRGAERSRRDSSLRDPARKNRAQEKNRVAPLGMTKKRPANVAAEAATS